MESTYLDANVDTPSRLSLYRKEIDKEMEEAEEMTLEMDHVSDMLTRLASNDKEIAKAAQEEIDNYLLQKEHRKQQDLIKKNLTEDCQIATEKTIINNKDTIKEKCKELSEEYKAKVLKYIFFKITIALDLIFITKIINCK